MKSGLSRCITAIIIFCLLTGLVKSQQILTDTINEAKLASYIDSDSKNYKLDNALPLFSFLYNRSKVNTLEKNFIYSDSSELYFLNYLTFFFEKDTNFSKGIKINLSITNISEDTAIIENMVPFGESNTDVHITGEGPWNLARTKLFRKGKEPIGVILPDNAWEMGYGAIQLSDGKSLCAIARRKDVENGKKHRYETHLYLLGSINYEIYILEYEGEWQNGLKLMFQDNYLFDLENFNDSLYKREDLSWIRDQYLMTLQFAWDHKFYDANNGGYQF